MILIWGTKPTDQKLGFVAEICPGCNAVNKVSVHRIGLTGHFFWIPVGKGQFVEAYGTCTSCNKKFNIELTDYETINKKTGEQIEDLIQITNPKLGRAGESLRKEFKRFSSIRKPFLVYGQYLNENAYNETKFDKTSGLAFLATFAIPILLGIGLSYIPKSPEFELAITQYLFLLFGVGFVISLVIFFRHSHRVLQKQTLPLIINDLYPLNPHENEIDDVLNKLNHYGYRICKFVNTKTVAKTLKNIPSNA